MSSGSAENVLSPEALLTRAPTVVGADAELPSPIAALAVLVHAIHVAFEFRTHAPATDDGDKLPSGWLANGARDGALSLEYRHPRSSMRFEVCARAVSSGSARRTRAIRSIETDSLDLT